MWMYTPVVSSVLFYLITLIYLFIYCYLAASGLSCGTQDLHCVMWEISFWSMDCALAECRLQSRWAPAVAACRLPSGGTEAPAHVGSVAAVPRLSCSAAWGILVPQPGIEPVSSASEGRFLTTGLPRKSPFLAYSYWSQWIYFSKTKKSTKLGTQWFQSLNLLNEWNVITSDHRNENRSPAPQLFGV